jgi:putative ABC transport system permease protein
MSGPAAWAILSHWRRNPWQLLTLIAGLALATALWSGVQAINAEARASYAQASDLLDRADRGQITRRDGAEITTEDYVALRRAGWQVSPLVEGRAERLDGLRLVGVEPLTLPRGVMRFEVSQDDGGSDNITGFPSGEEVILLHPDDMARLGGAGLNLRADPNRRPGTAVADIATALKYLPEGTGIARLLLAETQPLGVRPLPAAFQRSTGSMRGDVARLTQSFHLNLTAFGLLSFAVGIFIVYGAVGLAFEQRRGVLRTLRALGVSLRRLMLLLALELGLFALVAGGMGVALGYVIAAALLPDVAATLRGLYGAEITGQLQLRPVWWVSGLAMAFAGTSVAAAAALLKLARMPLLSFNHPRAMSLGALVAGRWLAGLALALFAIAALVGALGEGLFAGFVLLACLLVGAAFCLPAVLAMILSLAARGSKNALAQWFWADSRQQLPGLSMALMALLLAMAANIGVSTMVSSFRLTFTAYLDQRLASDLYVRAQTDQEATRLAAYLSGQAEAVLPIISVNARIGGLPAEIYGIRDHATYRDNWPLLYAVPEVWDRLARGEGALINEQMARRNAYVLEDILPSGDVILGVYGDYGNAAGQVLINADVFAVRHPQVRAQRFGVRTNRPEALAETLVSEFGLTPDAVVNQADLKAFSLSVFERTFAVTAALNALTLSVAGLAILISLLTLATMRLPQLAPVWALGLTRARLARLELLRAFCLASLTGLLALPLGLALAWVLLAVVNVEAFGWRLPMFVFPMDYLKLGALAVLAAFLAALWPAVRLARTPPQALLTVFSNER